MPIICLILLLLRIYSDPWLEIQRVSGGHIIEVYIARCLTHYSRIIVRPNRDSLERWVQKGTVDRLELLHVVVLLDLPSVLLTVASCGVPSGDGGGRDASLTAIVCV